MVITFTCEHCGAEIRAAAKFAGKTGKCQKCGARMQVPEAIVAVEAPIAVPAQPVTEAQPPEPSPTKPASAENAMAGPPPLTGSRSRYRRKAVVILALAIAAAGGITAVFMNGPDGTASFDGVKVRVVSATEQIAYIQLFGHSEEERLLIIQLEIANTSQTRKFMYRTWSSEEGPSLVELLANKASGDSSAVQVRPAATLRDNFGNTYKAIGTGLGDALAGRTASASVYPLKKIIDVLAFEPPVAGAEWVELTLPGDNVEHPDETERLRILMDTIRPPERILAGAVEQLKRINAERAPLTLKDVASLNFVEVRITSATRERMKLSDAFSDRQRFEDEGAVFRIEIKNTSSDRKIEFTPWSMGISTHAPTLKDNVGNVYDLQEPPPLASRVERADFGSVYPGKAARDIVVFEPPVGGADWLELVLPGEACDQPGTSAVYRIRLKATEEAQQEKNN